jgi:hypothetical protein
MRLQDLVQGKSCKVLITTLLTLSAIPICVVYPVLDAFHLTCHGCINFPQIDVLGTKNPAYKFYLSPIGESPPSSNAKLSAPSFMAELQSGCLQSNSSDSGNPYHHHICFDNKSVWGRDSSNPSNPSIWETRSGDSRDSSSSYQVYYEDRNDGETKRLQSSSSSSKSCQG